MQLYDLDSKMTNKSYEILNVHVEEQKELGTRRISEVRARCRNILEKNGIFEDRKNGIIYQNMDKELKKLEENILYFNENNLEEITKNKIDIGIDNIVSKIECLEQNTKFSSLEDEYTYNKYYNEKNIKNMIFSYFEEYKAETVEELLKKGYSQNTIDNIEEDILQYVTSKNSDILAEKLLQDGLKNITSLSTSLNELSDNILNEAEARYNCKMSGTVYDELKEKRNIIKEKAIKLENLIAQINSIDLKANQLI